VNLVARKIVDNNAANHFFFFLDRILDGKLEEIIAYYNELSNVIEQQHEAEHHEPDMISWASKEITEHQGPFNLSDSCYKESSYNVLIHWEDISETYEPLSVMAKEDPITSCAKYAAKENDIFDKPGLKSLKHIAYHTVYRPSSVPNNMVIPTRLVSSFQMIVIMLSRSIRATTISFGSFLLRLKWIKLMNMTPFATWERGARPPCNHERIIRVAFLFNIKDDLHCKSHLDAGGHMTAPPKDSLYSGIVTLRSLRLCMFLGELNSLGIDAVSVGNAYLMAFTK
jgi:hypothetical protein